MSPPTAKPSTTDTINPKGPILLSLKIRSNQSNRNIVKYPIANSAATPTHSIMMSDLVKQVLTGEVVDAQGMEASEIAAKPIADHHVRAIIPLTNAYPKQRNMEVAINATTNRVN